MSIFGRIEQFLNRFFISLGCAGFKLVVLTAESSAPHQMTHQSDIVFRHPCYSLISAYQSFPIMLALCMAPIQAGTRHALGVNDENSEKFQVETLYLALD